LAKKVMIALAPAGGGHLSVTRALSEALSELAPDVTISAVNVYSAEYGVFPVPALPRLYALLAVNSPALWRRVYYSTCSQTRYSLIEKAAQPWLRPTLKAALQATQPDVVVSALPALGYTMQRALRDLGWRCPLAVVVSDLINIHPAWITRGAAWYAVPTEEARLACVRAGVAPESIHVLGLPVSRAFTEPPADRAALRRRLGVPQEARVVLIMGGADGAGPVEETVQQLLASGVPAFPVVIAGRNERLRRRLSARIRPSAGRVLGFVGNMAEWMWAADLLVTKAGPNTIMEAVHCGLPIVLTGALPGQEEGNIDFVVANGLGTLATRPREIVQAVGRLLGDDEERAAIRQAMARVRRPQAARDIAQLILATCEQAGERDSAVQSLREGA
jgi:1,2-diacylglycerol 3-beta-galactosyltransferase